MQIPLQFQLLADPPGIAYASMGNLPINGKFPIEAKGIPNIG